ncbi:CNNM domain-containing protein [Halosegnis marinus]|uniref:CNNM domain-containing protein n=1 Tax=Halosegnis marinus TaxID=3034023 RepID=A0ABD5ZPV5_9EURY|nr:hemolysin family protein [Halosegnis sp. DT85]
MQTLELAVRLLAGVALILANGFFVAIEFALTRARQFSESQFVGGNPKLERAWEMTNDLELYLTTCQVGITASSIAVGIVAEPALAALFEPLFVGTTLASVGAGAVIAFLIINLVHLTHGEQTPTYLGVERSRFVCRYGATPLYWFQRLISPLITLGDGVAKWTLKLFGIEMTGAWLETEEDVIESRADLRTRLSSVLDRGDLSQERVAEVLSALTAGETPVSSVMVPAEDIAYLRVGETERNLETLSERTFTRYPLVGDAPEDFRGVVYVPSIVEHLDELRSGDRTFEDLATEQMVVSPETSVSDAVDQFQTQHQELALVMGDGEVVGLLTATDALESVMGEIEDPYDVAGDSDPAAA